VRKVPTLTAKITWWKVPTLRRGALYQPLYNKRSAIVKGEGVDPAADATPEEGEVGLYKFNPIGYGFQGGS
jgi:hypothetical protein